VRELAARVWFVCCGVLGRLLRSATYSKVWIVVREGERQVRKHRRFYAPFLVWTGRPLLWVLDTGVRVLPQRAWEERERRVCQSLRRASIRIDADSVLVLPWLGGVTLATLLEDLLLEESVRTGVIEQAVVALVEFHRLGWTHGDAMAENVLVDVEAGVAHWFDFETMHDPSRPLAWRRADDLRALTATCLLRTGPEKLAPTLQLILAVYGDEDVIRLLAASFTSVWQRALTFHLAQAPLSFACFREIGRLLKQPSSPGTKS
jgi:serine/threonine protein kinase